MARNLALKLLVPATTHPDIFAWGVQCLRYSVGRQHPDVPVEVLDLRQYGDFAQAWLDLRTAFGRDLGDAMSSAYRRLKINEPGGGLANERNYHYLAAWLMIAQARPALPRALAGLSRLLDRRGEEARALVARMDTVLQELLKPEAGVDLLVGISSYQYILLDSLFLAHRARALFPEAKIILGGDPLDVPTATQVLKNPWIDGCVSGPGEYALNELVRLMKEGNDIRKVFVPRFANETFLADPEANIKEWNTVVAQRSEYDAVLGYHGVEWSPASNIIHLLGRRGCTWAACTFCHRSHVVSQEQVFDPSTSLMRQELARLLDDYYGGRLATAGADALLSRQLYQSARYAPKRDPSAPLYIRWDADDGDVADMIGLASWLNTQVPEGKKLVFFSYAPARQLARPYAHALARATDPKRMQVRLGVPIETLNPKTARTMKKGINPVDAVKAIKVAGDSGALYGGLYFAFYPLESLEDVRQECEYIDRSLHLLVERYLPNVYTGSYRDLIGQNPSKYAIELDTDGDPLMTLLGMEIRSDSSRRYTVLGSTPLARLQNAYLSLFSSLRTWRLESSVRMRLNAAWTGLRSILSCLLWMTALRDFSYAKRIVLLYACAALPPSRVRLYFRGGEIIRERPWYLGGRWRKALNKVEVRLLRFLYERRRVKDVLAELKDVPGVEKLLEEFKRLGLVIEYNGLVISVVNDPTGLRESIREENLAELRRLQEVEDNGLGTVRASGKPRTHIDALNG